MELALGSKYNEDNKRHMGELKAQEHLEHN